MPLTPSTTFTFSCVFFPLLSAAPAQDTFSHVVFPSLQHSLRLSTSLFQLLISLVFVVAYIILSIIKRIKICNYSTGGSVLKFVFMSLLKLQVCSHRSTYFFTVYYFYFFTVTYCTYIKKINYFVQVTVSVWCKKLY